MIFVTLFINTVAVFCYNDYPNYSLAAILLSYFILAVTLLLTRFNLSNLLVANRSLIISYLDFASLVANDNPEIIKEAFGSKAEIEKIASSFKDDAILVAWRKFIAKL